jgi:hypothetical protein
VFIDALRRQIQLRQATALEDLDPELIAVPESFLNYVAAPPGDALLDPSPIDEYLYVGEAARSTQGSLVLDAIRDAAALRQPLRALRTSVPDRQERAQEALRAMSPLEGKLSSLFKRSLRRNSYAQICNKRPRPFSASPTRARTGPPSSGRSSEEMSMIACAESFGVWLTCTSRETWEARVELRAT